MSSAQDPVYIMKEEVQDSIDKLQNTFHHWERIPSDNGEPMHLTKKLFSSCESIEWQKLFAVAAKGPDLYGIDEIELDRRRGWTSTARTQVGIVKKALYFVKEINDTSIASANGMRRELLRLPDSDQSNKYNHYSSQDNGDFITSESDNCKRQDEELDEISDSVERFRGIGLTIHDELLTQDKIIGDLGSLQRLS